MDKDKQIKQEATIMAKMNPNMANREVMNLVLLDYKTKVPFMKIDFANVSTTNFQANRVYAKGGWGAPNRVGFDGERTGTLQIDTLTTTARSLRILRRMLGLLTSLTLTMRRSRVRCLRRKTPARCLRIGLN